MVIFLVSLKMIISKFNRMSFWSKVFGVIAVISVFLTIFFGVLPFFVDYLGQIEIDKEPIIVFPKLINLGSGEWKTSEIIKLYNQSDKTYYQIWTKIIIDSNLIDYNDIHITCKTCKNLRIIEFGEYAASADLYSIFGKDINGNKVVYVYVSELGPLETKNLEFSNSFSGFLVGENKASLFVKSFSFEQPSFGKSSPNHAGFLVAPPEYFFQEGISIIKVR